MDREVHIDAEKARSGSTPHIVRWVLVISLLAAILILSAVWISGAWISNAGDTPPASEEQQVEDRALN